MNSVVCVGFNEDYMGKSWSDRGKQFNTILASRRIILDTITEDLMRCLKQAK